MAEGSAICLPSCPVRFIANAWRDHPNTFSPIDQIVATPLSGSLHRQWVEVPTVPFSRLVHLISNGWRFRYRSFSSSQFNRFAQMLAMSCVCWCCVCDAHHLSFNSKTVNSQAPISNKFRGEGAFYASRNGLNGFRSAPAGGSGGGCVSTQWISS